MVVQTNDPVIQAFVERLSAAFDLMKVESRGRPKWLAKRLEISTTAVQNYIYGKSLPHGKRWQKIADVLQVNVTWLRDGVGPMRDMGTDAFAQELWNLWPKLDDNTKRDLVGAARVAAKTAGRDPFQTQVVDRAAHQKAS